MLWIVNIGVFTVWYWEIERGDPLKRHSGKSEPSDFLFPEMTFEIPGWEKWTPSFLFAVIYEKIALLTDLFYYNDWKLSYSAIIYPFLSIKLIINLK